PAARSSSRPSRLAMRSTLIAVLGALSAGCGDAPCSEADADGACRTLRVMGIDPAGELGFRFGEPADLDGDGVEDIVAGSRFAGDGNAGEALIWTAGGHIRERFHGFDVDALFGNAVLIVPGLD